MEERERETADSVPFDKLRVGNDSQKGKSNGKLLGDAFEEVGGLGGGLGDQGCGQGVVFVLAVALEEGEDLL